MNDDYDTIVKDSTEKEIIWFKERKDAVIPYCASKFAGGYDLTVVSVRKLDITKQYPYDVYELDTGICVKPPPGWQGLLVLRSSMTKRDMIMLNSVGLIDNDYRGTLRFRVASLTDISQTQSTNSNLFDWTIGKRIGQYVPIQMPQFLLKECTDKDEFMDTERGDGGFGSTN